MQAKSIMIQGTSSGTGKSLLVAGLCRVLGRKGYRATPFKSQNMALNSFVTADGLEISRSQAMQAQSAGIPPDVRMNPVLLKPNSDTGSQVVVMGKAVGHMPAAEYFAYKTSLVPVIREAYRSLAGEYDVIVLEGAGSPAEINLKREDIVNMGLAGMTRSPVLLAGDINPGGVFAALAGTMLLLEPHERELVKGVIINKFRGDPDILRPGLLQLEEIIHRPVLGVVPYLRVDIDEEDSMSHRLANGAAGLVDIGVIRFPRLSNFTDFSPFAAMAGVSLRYVDSPQALGNPDLIILPGTKSTMADLRWMRDNGLEGRVLAHAGAGKPVWGICGGYQMMGQRLEDPQGVEGGGAMQGLGLFAQVTRFQPEKTLSQVSGQLCRLPGLFSSLSGEAVAGYEIHMGRTDGEGEQPLCLAGSPGGDTKPQGAARDNLYGCYVHGLFDSPGIAPGIVGALCRAKGVELEAGPGEGADAYREAQYNLLADALEDSLDIPRILDIIQKGV